MTIHEATDLEIRTKKSRVHLWIVGPCWINQCPGDWIHIKQNLKPDLLSRSTLLALYKSSTLPEPSPAGGAGGADCHSNFRPGTWTRTPKQSVMFEFGPVSRFCLANALREGGQGWAEIWSRQKVGCRRNVALMMELMMILNLVDSATRQQRNYFQQSIHFETYPTYDVVGDHPVLTKLIHLQSLITMVTNTLITYRII